MSVSHILNKKIQKQTHDLESHMIIARVLQSDPMNNVCTIQFVDDGKLCNKDNVSVRIYGTGMDWFPLEGDWVKVEYSRNICEIVARADNFSTDIRPDTYFGQDRLSEGIGGTPGGSCTGD